MSPPPIDVGPFRLERPIGKGGMGEVWQAVHRERGTPVAVKVLTIEEARDRLFGPAFRNEVRVVASLHHPGIVHVYDHGTIDRRVEAASAGRLVAGAPYMVLELARGDMRRLRPRSWPMVRDALFALLDALAHAHARGVVHRDLKPGNLLIASDGRTPLLTDFGLAHLARDRTRPPHARGGTPDYLAPELAMENWRDVGPWSDLYALGCVVHKLVVGRAPFEGRSTPEIVAAHLGEQPPPLDPRFPVPPALGEWVARLLGKHPTQRYRRAADAAWALVEIDRSAPGRLREPSVPPVHTTPTLSSMWTREIETAGEQTEHLSGGSPTAAHPAGHEAPAAVEGPVRPWLVEPPPMPADWRSAVQPRRVPDLPGSGLGIYGIREIPLVGRELERDALWEALGDVRRTQQAGLVLLEGATGVGKSRLAAWLVERAHEVGTAATALHAAHDPSAAEGVAGHGLGPMIERHLGLGGLPRSEASSRIASTLRDLGLADARDAASLTELLMPAADGETTSIRFSGPREWYALLARVLHALAGAESEPARPLIVWLEDVQWAPDALAFCDYVLSPRDEPLPLLLLLTARTEALAGRPDEQRMLESLLGRPRTRRIRLAPLAAGARRELVRELLGLDGDLAASVEERSGGYPLFAVQLVGDWVERRLLVPSDHGFRLSAAEPPAVPTELHEVWTARLDPLLAGRPEDAIALELAAVLGQQVDLGEWRRVCAAGDVPFPDDLIQSLLDLGLLRVEAEGTGRLAFGHTMLRECLERRARAGGRLRGHHALCAGVIGRRQVPASTARLGHHLLAAERHAEAIQPLFAGARGHLARSDFRPALLALGDLRQALEGAGIPREDRRWTEHALLLGHACRARGELAEGRQHAERALADAVAAGWTDLEAQALVRLAELERLSGTGTPRERLRRAERLARADGDEHLLATIWRDLGVLLAFTGDIAGARVVFAKALDAYTTLGDDGGAGTCAIGLASCGLQLGLIDDADQLLERAEELCTRAGSRWALALIENNRADVALRRGRLDVAEARFARAAREYDALDHMGRLGPRVGLARVRIERGRWEEAERLLREVAASYERQGWRNRLIVTGALLLACAAHRGDGIDVDRMLREVAVLFGETRYVEDVAPRELERAARMLERSGDRARSAAADRLAATLWRGLDRPAEAHAAEARAQRASG